MTSTSRRMLLIDYICVIDMLSNKSLINGESFTQCINLYSQSGGLFLNIVYRQYLKHIIRDHHFAYPLYIDL